MHHHPLPTIGIPARLLIVAGLALSHMSGAPSKDHSYSASEVFSSGRTILFQDDFQSGKFGRWKFSVNADYGIPKPPADRIAIVDAPGLGEGHKAARFVVPRAPNSFRSELALPHEMGVTERWYGERIFIPADWAIDDGKGDDIVMQWHAIPGNWRSTYPNLSLSIGGDKWWIKQNYGAAQTGPTRTSIALGDPVKPGTWVAFVVHARWSAGDDGFLKIWKDDALVYERTGANIYTTIGVAYSPYFKTGIYHPTWNLKTPDRQSAFEKSSDRVKKRIIYVADVKVGGERARYEDIAPPSSAASTQK